jgi:AcrR family transcriptional regulator
MCDNGGVPVEKWTPERRKQRTREALLDAAFAVFAKRGFQAASLDEIAETAGYTRGAIYKHFADKEELLHEVCARLNERTFAEFDELEGMDQPWAEVDMEQVVAHWRRMVERDREFRIVMLEFLLHALRNPEQRTRANEFARANAAATADYLAQRAAEFDEKLPLPVEDVALVFGIASDGFAQATLFDPDAGRLFGVFLDLIMRGLQSYAAETDDRHGQDS